MSADCSACIHFSECMEQRGPCKEFKTLEGIKNDVQRINADYKKLARRTRTDKARACNDEQREAVSGALDQGSGRNEEAPAQDSEGKQTAEVV